jgi:hypothetical protein
MRADDQLRISLRDMTPDFAFAIFFQGTGQQDNAISRRLKDLAR